MIRKPFEQWLFEDVEIAFHIERVKNMLTLVKWLDVSKNNILDSETERLRVLLADNVESWNEDELKMMFIAPFLSEFAFNNLPAYRVFMQRQFSIQTEEIEASGRVEWFIATGKQTPKKTFFFLQDFKPEKKFGKRPSWATFDSHGGCTNPK